MFGTRRPSYLEEISLKASHEQSVEPAYGSFDFGTVACRGSQQSFEHIMVAPHSPPQTGFAAGIPWESPFSLHCRHPRRPLGRDSRRCVSVTRFVMQPMQRFFCRQRFIMFHSLCGLVLLLTPDLGSEHSVLVRWVWHSPILALAFYCKVWGERQSTVMADRRQSWLAWILTRQT